MRETCAVVAKPMYVRSTECVRRNTSPGAPKTVMVDICVRFEVHASFMPGCKFKQTVL